MENGGGRRWTRAMTEEFWGVRVQGGKLRVVGEVNGGGKMGVWS